MKIASIGFLAAGLIVIALAIRGSVIGEVPFFARNGDLYLITSKSDQVLFWFVEGFYFFGGVVSALFGAKELKENDF